MEFKEQIKGELFDRAFSWNSKPINIWIICLMFKPMMFSRVYVVLITNWNKEIPMKFTDGSG